MGCRRPSGIGLEQPDNKVHKSRYILDGYLDLEYFYPWIKASE